MKAKLLTIKFAITLLMAVCCFVFWAIPYRAALSYQEQYQLFLLGYDYFANLADHPGGIATYIAEFIVQFYNNYWIGALILSAIFVTCQLLTWRISVNISHKKLTDAAYALTLLPVIALWVYMGDINVMPTTVVALLLALLLAWPMTRIRGKAAECVYAGIIVPVFYWLFGPAVYLLTAIMCIKVCFAQRSTVYKLIWTAAAILLTVATILVAAKWTNYPIDQQLVGINYYRFPTQLPLMQIGIMLLFALVIIANATARLAGSRFMASKYTPYAIIIAALALAYPGYRFFYDTKTYELIDYDYLIRTNNWDAIIKKAERQSPDLPMSVCATNLALGMTNQLCTRAFDFYQNGSEGLLPPFNKESNSSMTTGEVYFQLGLINTAQRFYFEAMEAIPNYNKSSRCLKRLAETNMIRGNYEIALKYLRLLEKTVFYRKWAQRHIALINQSGAIDSHPLYGQLRQRQIDDDFLFSEPEIDKIIGQLYVTNSNNMLAKQFLVMYPILQRDLPKLIQYLPVVQNQGQYSPLIAQQAVLLAYVKAGKEIPAGLTDPMVLQQFKEFAQIWANEGKDSPRLDRFKNTAWRYLIEN